MSEILIIPKILIFVIYRVLTTLYGLFMVIWGIAISLISGSTSITSMIFLYGVPLAFIGFISMIN